MSSIPHPSAGFVWLLSAGFASSTSSSWHVIHEAKKTRFWWHMILHVPTYNRLTISFFAVYKWAPAQCGLRTQGPMTTQNMFCEQRIVCFMGAKKAWCYSSLKHANESARHKNTTPLPSLRHLLFDLGWTEAKHIFDKKTWGPVLSLKDQLRIICCFIDFEWMALASWPTNSKWF